MRKSDNDNNMANYTHVLCGKHTVLRRPLFIFLLRTPQHQFLLHYRLAQERMKEIYCHIQRK